MGDRPQAPRCPGKMIFGVEKNLEMTQFSSLFRLSAISISAHNPDPPGTLGGPVHSSRACEAKFPLVFAGLDRTVVRGQTTGDRGTTFLAKCRFVFKLSELLSCNVFESFSSFCAECSYHKKGRDEISEELMDRTMMRCCRSSENRVRE